MSMNTTRATLLVRIRNASDLHAWAEFDAIYRPLLTRFAHQKGLSEQDAEDVVQHCMVKIHEHIGSFEYDSAKGRFKAWLRRIAQNFILNQWAKRHESRASTGVFEVAPASDLGPDEEFDKIWKQEHLRRAFAMVQQDVTAETFGAFRDYIVNGKSVEETCQIWNINRNTLDGIKFRLTRKLGEKLTELLGHECEW